MNVLKEEYEDQNYNGQIRIKKKYHLIEKLNYEDGHYQGMEILNKYNKEYIQIII